MHEWLVGGAVVEAEGRLLLVRNRRRGGAVDWTPPGGVIEGGEPLIDGLTREVREETGLLVTDWTGPLWDIVVQAPGLGWHLRVEVHRADAFEGCLDVDDPDGIVSEARFVEPAAVVGHLSASHPWVVDPLLEWLESPWVDRRSYAYRVEGDDLARATVVRG